MQERKNCLYFALFLRSTPMKLSSELLGKIACESLFALLPGGNEFPIHFSLWGELFSSAFINAGFNGPLWRFCVKWKHVLEKSKTRTNMAERNTNAIQNTQMFRPFNR
jgi:hypothetical protein